MDKNCPVVELSPGALLVLCGPAGRGKSYFAREHFKETEVVSSDKCRAMLCDDPGNMSASGRAFELFHTIIRHRLHLRRTTVADSTALTSSARKQLLTIAQECGAPAVLLIFNASRELCLRRNEQRDRKVPGDVVDNHLNRLNQTLDTAHSNGFDAVVVLQDDQVDGVTVRRGRSSGPTRRQAS